MLERAGKRLLHLPPERRVRIVRQPVVLPAHVGELGLQEQLIARDPGGRDRRPDPGLEVVLALVRRVDAPEPDLQRQPGQPLGAVLLPRGAVDEPRHPHPLHLDEPFHAVTIAPTLQSRHERPALRCGAIAAGSRRDREHGARAGGAGVDAGDQQQLLDAARRGARGHHGVGAGQGAADRGWRDGRDFDGRPVATEQRPSAETVLPTWLYRRDAGIGCVLHTHSLVQTVASRVFAPSGGVRLEGYELAKAIAGTTTHETVIELPILANSQDMPATAGQVEACSTPVRFRDISSPATVSMPGAATWPRPGATWRPSNSCSPASSS